MYYGKRQANLKERENININHILNLQMNKILMFSNSMLTGYNTLIW